MCSRCGHVSARCRAVLATCVSSSPHPWLGPRRLVRCISTFLCSPRCPGFWDAGSPPPSLYLSGTPSHPFRLILAFCPVRRCYCSTWRLVPLWVLSSSPSGLPLRGTLTSPHARRVEMELTLPASLPSPPTLLLGCLS